MKHIIIGGVAGGATAAARIRRVDESAEIVLLEKGKYISYANCGLPYYIGGVIEDRENLFLQTPEAFGKKLNVDVRTENEVVSIDPQTKTVTIVRGNKSEYKESYDKLLLSPGAFAVRPLFKGVDGEGIFTLRNVLDTDKIKAYVEEKRVKRAVVVGAGFIGLEMAENLQHAGAKVSIVEMADQVMAPIDYSMASLVHEELLNKGVELHLQEAVAHFEHQNNTIKVVLNSGKELETDMVILSIGVKPETKLALNAGIKIGDAGGIAVNEYLETSVKDIYAVGDAIEYPHPLTGKPWLNYLAGPANRQGRIVADNMVKGNVQPYEGAIGTSIAKVFDMTVAATGLPAKRLRQMGIAYQSSTTQSNSHAGYYPGALPLLIKLVFDPESGKLYGAQIVGYEGVDKRIDQIALLIKMGGTVYDLMKIEHAYAPPYSSAKDPVAIAGYVAGNIISGAMPVVYWREMREVDAKRNLILDVRSEEEFALGAIPGAVNIPVEDIRERMAEIPRDKPLYIYCAGGLRGYLAIRTLMANGYTDIRNLSGGYKLYASAVAEIKNKRVLPSCCSSAGNLKDSDCVKIVRVDACGMQCPGPILKLKNSMEELDGGARLEVIATDAGFVRDAQSWCNMTGNSFVSSTSDKGRYTVVVEKGGKKVDAVEKSGRGKTFILFSDDLDKALATFVLANGAAATGEKVTVFCTFWGLNVIKKIRKPKVRKDLFGRMFSMMLPANSLKLKLSKMNMGGMGKRMMRYIMKYKGIDSLESLREQALEQGVEFIACQMSMDVMGVKAEELLDGVTIGGVATYMERADQANVNLFV
ncbi:FAD-dependent oxidoreductase [Odoribacter sp. OttesenSCG-928-J03]|nr:FAD-dependent oxidoreductase [Odoribacter sp. OttesenSCG-928-J03]MDL2282996.1 FAD-dependent oxidoreductase [Odoribacter sp. OttesenSCG-928-G04]MDL2331110.1 FAD-dependent oxidoreductase [Odoribacter sp. OttesenSCG-928-A06]